MQSQVERFDNLCIKHIDHTTSQVLAAALGRTMDIQVSIQDEEVTWNCAEQTLSFVPALLYI